MSGRHGDGAIRQREVIQTRPFASVIWIRFKGSPRCLGQRYLSFLSKLPSVFCQLSLLKQTVHRLHRGCPAAIVDAAMPEAKEKWSKVEFTMTIITSSGRMPGLAASPATNRR